MRAESLLREKNRLLDKLAKTAWAETAIFLALTVCFLFFIKPWVNSAIEPLRMSWLPSDRVSLACVLPMRYGSLRAYPRINRLQRGRCARCRD